MKIIRLNKTINEALLDEAPLKAGDLASEKKLSDRIIDLTRVADAARSAAKKAETDGNNELAAQLTKRADDLEELARTATIDKLDDDQVGGTSDANGRSNGEDSNETGTAKDSDKADDQADGKDKQGKDSDSNGQGDQQGNDSQNQNGKDGQNKDRKNDQKGQENAKDNQGKGSQDNSSDGLDNKEGKDSQNGKDSQGTDDKNSQGTDSKDSQGNNNQNNDSKGSQSNSQGKDSKDSSSSNSNSQGEDKPYDGPKADDNAEGANDDRNQYGGSQSNSNKNGSENQSKSDTDSSSSSDSNNSSQNDNNGQNSQNNNSNSKSDSKDKADNNQKGDESDSDAADNDDNTDNQNSKDSKGKPSKGKSDGKGSGDSDDDGEDSDSDNDQDSQGQSSKPPKKDPFADEEDIPQMGGMGMPQMPEDATLDDIIKQLKKLAPDAKAGAIAALKDLLGGSKNESLNEAYKSVREMEDDEFADLINDTLNLIDKANPVVYTQNKKQRIGRIQQMATDQDLKTELTMEISDAANKEHQKIKARDEEAQKHGQFGGIREFSINFYNAIKSQIDLVYQTYATYDEINPEYEDEDIIMKTDVEKQELDEALPVVDVYFDRSSS